MPILLLLNDQIYESRVWVFILSIIVQYSLFSLIMKIILIVFDSLMNNISCKIISYIYSMFILVN